MQEYCLGFAFDKTLMSVALIKKNRPEWQAGKLNGIGGHVEPGEAPLEAMRREYKEETGYKFDDWKLFCKYHGPDYIMWVYKAQIINLVSLEFMPQTDEPVGTYPVMILNTPGQDREGKYKLAWETIPNLKWLIPLALDVNIKTTIIHEHNVNLGDPSSMEEGHPHDS